MQIIEKNGAGYRLSVPPDNIFLVTVPEEESDDTNAMDME